MWWWWWWWGGYITEFIGRLLHTGFPLATYFHPTAHGGSTASQRNTGGASQWSMVGALIIYYMTFSFDIFLVLRATPAPNTASDKQQK